MRLISLIALAALCAGCSNDNAKEKKKALQPELLVYSGAGIQPPIAELVEIFGREESVKVVTDYAGSEVLLSKIRLSGRGDVYIPGDVHYVLMADSLGLIRSHEPLFFWVPTILVRKGNPESVTGLSDFVRPGLRVGVGNENACAIGRATRKLMVRNGIAWEEVKKNLSFQSMTVNELGIQIQAGSLDAVIVWDAIADYYSSVGDQVPIPAGKNIISTVDAGILESSANPALAARLVEFLRSERGRRVFTRHKFQVNKPE